MDTIWFPAEAHFSFLHHTQTASGAHVGSYGVFSGDCAPGENGGSETDR
jgi:hypothetical protein